MKRFLCVLLAVLMFGSCWVTAGASEAPGEDKPIKVVISGEVEMTKYCDSITEAIETIGDVRRPVAIYIIKDTGLTGNITLPEDTTLYVEQNVNVTSDANINFSGNYGNFVVCGALTITGGQIASSDNSAVAVSSGHDLGVGQLTVEDGTLEGGKGCAISVGEGCQVTLSGGTFKSLGSNYNGEYHSAIDFSNISPAECLAPGYAFADEDGNFIETSNAGLETATTLKVAHKHDFGTLSGDSAVQYVKCSHDFCDVKMTASQTPLKPEFGQSANLTVTFEGSEKVTYEWKKGAEELGPPAATERFSQYNVPADLPISSTPYEYTCTVRQGGAVIATAEFSVKVEPKSISGAQVTLDRENITLSDNPADNKVTVTAVEPDGKKLVEGVDYTVEGTGPFTVPGRYTVGITGIGSYGGTVEKEVLVGASYPLDAPNADKKVEVSAELSSCVTPGPDEPTIEEQLESKAREALPGDAVEVATYEVTLKKVKDDGTEEPVTQNEFKAMGSVTVTLPFPPGIERGKEYEYVVVHWPYTYSNADDADTVSGLGEAEVFKNPTVTDKGLQCTFTTLCPVAIGYKEKKSTSGGGSSGGGSGGGWWPSYYSVKVEPSEHGTVTADRTSVTSGTRVTLTVTPEEGYELGGITVTDSGGKEIELEEDGEKLRFVMPSRDVTVRAEFSLIPPPPPPPWENPFPDVIEGQWYYGAVEFVHTRGLMAGYANGLFGTNDMISRAQFAQILHNMAGRPEPGGECSFRDVPENAWYAKAVTWAVEEGILSGYGGHMAGPNDPITREQLAAMLWRYAGRPEPAGAALDYTDADKVSGYARKALCWAAEKGIVTGKPGNLLDPGGNATRAETARMLMSYLSE